MVILNKVVSKGTYSIIDGMPPEINLLNEKNNGESLLKLIDQNLILSAHDVSNGGLIIALSEMALKSNLVPRYLNQKS